MDISRINLSKNQFHSEDFVDYEIIDNTYCVMINSGGSGSAGTCLKTDVYQFETNLFELGSTVAITTHHYSKRILRDITRHIKMHGFNFGSFYNCLIGSLESVRNENSNSIYFCILISVLNFVEKKIYVFNIGDCGYTLLDLDTKEIVRNSPHSIKKLSFNGRGTALVACPNTVHNDKLQGMEDVAVKLYKMPNHFVYIQYSAGLDYDIAVPITELEKNMGKVIDFDTQDFSGPEVVKSFSTLLKEKLKRDKPNTIFSRYNLTARELKNIVSSQKNSKNIITHIMKHIFAIDGRRRKYDDISICVLCHK